jgi:uncharacterized protein (TIGR02231 family)
MVQIAELKLPAEFFYEATPLLTEAVYRYAEVENTSDVSLLGGRAGVYLDNEFMGTAELPMVARGQKVTVGFGTDPQLRAWREFVSRDSKDRLFGGKKVVSYKYRLVLDNYGDQETEVRVFDRIPLETENIKVKLAELKDALNTNAHYTRVYRPQGILRWDVKVPGKATRETARIIEYGFALEFDAKLHISPGAPPAPAARQKIMFKKIMDERMYMH